MLHSKNGDIMFYVIDPESGQTWDVHPATYLTSQQAGDMEDQPDMAVQFSHFLADEWRKQGYENVEVRAQAYVSLNGREPALLIDPTVDLASVELSVMPADWLTSLEEQQNLARMQDGIADELRFRVEEVRD